MVRVSALDGARKAQHYVKSFLSLLQTLPSKGSAFPLLGHGTRSSCVAGPVNLALMHIESQEGECQIYSYWTCVP